MTDISKEAVELHIQRCWLTDPEPDKTETLLRALSARVEEAEKSAACWKQQVQSHELYELGRLQALGEAAKLAADDAETLPSNCSCRYGKTQGEICSRATARNLEAAIKELRETVK